MYKKIRPSLPRATATTTGLSNAQRCRIGGSLSVQGRSFSFIDPPLVDRSHTTWIYDHGSEVLFTADGFGSYHDPMFGHILDKF